MRGQQQKHHRPEGFTVIEVFMVVLLLSAVLTLVIVNYFSFDGAWDKRPAIDQIHRAVSESHRIARTERIQVSLYYDADSESMMISDQKGKTLARYAFPPGTDAELQFFRIKPEGEMQEELNAEPEDDPIQLVHFYPHGVSMPFLVEYEVGDDARLLQFDPFSAISHDNENVF